VALVVLLRGVNVGGHRTFRPSVLAKQLRSFDVANIGAAGTFVIRGPVSREKLRAELSRRLPFQTEVIMCDGRDFLRLVDSDPFRGELPANDTVRFVSVLARRLPRSSGFPMDLPSTGPWSLRVLVCRDRFACGVYRRHMKAIGYLGQLDKIFGVPVTTRNWNTILSIVRLLKETA
jgi:uncharacterized protein (DUF1697 family)